MSPLRRVAFAWAVAMAWLVGCQLIVPSDLPDVRCASADPSACPSGMSCDLSKGRCVSATEPVEAGDEQEEIDGGDQDGDPDAPVDPAALGKTCIVDTDCASKLCGTSTTLTTSIISGTSKSICTQTCCTSADCPSSFICFGGGTGGTYCVPAAKAGRTPPASGGRSAGSTCSVPEDCRSGLCEGSRCIDTCCLASNCASGTTCRVREVTTPSPAHFIWACAPPNAGGLDSAPDAGCTLQSDCKNDNCVGFPKRCTPSCCTAAQCASQGFSSSVCAYGNTGNDQLKFCTPPGSGGAAVGTTCSDDLDCLSRYCDPELRKCALPCCTDADCASRTTCKPSKSGTPFLRCVATP